MGLRLNGNSSESPSSDFLRRYLDSDFSTRRQRPANDNPHRTKMYEIIEQFPGLNIEEVARMVGLTRNAIRHHVWVMTRKGFVATERQGKHLLLFTSQVPESERKAMALLRIPSVRATVDYLLSQPQFHWEELAKAIHASRRTARRAIRVLTRNNQAFIVTPSSRLDGGKHSLMEVSLRPELRVIVARWSQPYTPYSHGEEPGNAILCWLAFVAGYLGAVFYPRNPTWLSHVVRAPLT